MARRATTGPRPYKYDKFVDRYFRRAGGLYADAQRRFSQGRYPETVSAVQEALELIVKGMFRAAGLDPPARHQIDDRKFAEELRRVREAVRTWYPRDDEWEDQRMGRIFFLASFWAQAYIAAKYGSDVLDVGPSELFGRREAALAVNHLGEVVMMFIRPIAKSKGAQEPQLPEVQ